MLQVELEQLGGKSMRFFFESLHEHNWSRWIMSLEMHSFPVCISTEPLRG